MSEKQKCSELVPMFHGFGVSGCSKTAKVERDGKWYCTIHDPERRKKLSDERMARWQAASDREREDRRRVSRYDEAVELIALAHKDGWFSSKEIHDLFGAFLYTEPAARSKPEAGG